MLYGLSSFSSPACWLVVIPGFVYQPSLVLFWFSSTFLHCMMYMQMFLPFMLTQFRGCDEEEPTQNQGLKADDGGCQLPEAL